MKDGEPPASFILEEIYPANQLEWMTFGVPEQFIPRGQNEFGGITFLPLDGFTARSFRESVSLAPFYPLSLERIKTNVLFLYDRGREELSRQRSQILYTDPAIFLLDAENYYYTSGTGLKGPSPLNAIENTLVFLEALRRDHGHEGNIDAMEQDVVKILKQIRDEIQDTSKTYTDRLHSIFELAHLHDGITFISDRIKRIIEHALIHYITNNDVISNITLKHKLLLADRVIDELSSRENSNLTQLKIDVQTAMEVTTDTTQLFAEIFSDGLDRTIRQSRSKYIEANQEEQMLFARYCALLLGVPNWNSKKLRGIDLSLCEGQQLLSDWEKNPVNPLTVESYLGPPNQNRRCHFRNFLRKEKFLQIVSLEDRDHR